MRNDREPMMAAVDADSCAGLAGCYVHLPFCSAVCPYCDFAVVAGKDDLVERYCAAVRTEIAADEPWRALDAVYFGGGTPSRIAPAELGSILESLRSQHGLVDASEVTLEANPEDWSVEKARGLRRQGFNRVSFGAQSFDPSVLTALGRRHDPDQIRRAVDAARRGGFDNVSVDLIYGTPGESDDSWSNSVKSAVAAGPDHVSCYALTVESGTELGRQVRAGAPAPDPDVQADRFSVANELLTEAGLERYEVSNWAQPGKRCVYNSLVWAQGEYLAYGNGAHRFREGVRSRNLRHLEKYLEKVESGAAPLAGAERLMGWDLEVDRLFVGLRRSEGVSTGPGVDAFLASEEGSRLVNADVVSIKSGRLKVEDPMLTDEALRVVLGLEGGNQGENADTLRPTNA